MVKDKSESTLFLLSINTGKVINELDERNDVTIRSLCV